MEQAVTRPVGAPLMSNHVYIFSPLPAILKWKTYPPEHINDKYKNIDSKLLAYSDLRLIQVLLFGDISLDVNTNSSIINATIDFVISSKRFEKPFF